MRGGLPHSEIPGSTIARISPGLFAACHVLHRLSVPRHPPDALPSRFSRHTQRQRPSSAAILSVQKTLRDGTHRPETPPLGATPAAASVAVTQLASSQLSINKHPAGLKPVGNSVILPRCLSCFRPLSRGESFAFAGSGGERARTVDLLLAKQALSQLSYTPVLPEIGDQRSDIRTGVIRLQPSDPTGRCQRF